MKKLSCKFQMVESFNNENFDEIIISWLNGAKTREYADDMCEQFEASDRVPVELRTKYCKLETANIDDYRMLRLINEFHEQSWTTEAIFDGVKKTVTLHISCDGDSSRIVELPEIRTDISRSFVASGLIKKGKIPFTDKPVETSESLKMWLVDTVNGKEINSLPVVFLSKIEGMIGYAVDENRLARKLAGVAHVIVESDSDFAFNLRDITGRKLPYNGNVGVFYPDARQNKNYRYGNVSERDIVNEVTAFVTGYTHGDCVDWDILHTRENGALVEILDSDVAKLKSELEEKDRRLKELESKCTYLQSVVDGLKNSNGIIEPAVEQELFDFEQYDLIISALETALRVSVEGTRRYELLESLLKANSYKNVGREIFDRAKAIITKGKLTDRDYGELKKLGFELLRDDKHCVFIFKDDTRHKLTFPGTPSDPCSGANTASDVLNAISIYK